MEEKWRRKRKFCTGRGGSNDTTEQATRGREKKRWWRESDIERERERVDKATRQVSIIIFLILIKYKVR